MVEQGAIIMGENKRNHEVTKRQRLLTADGFIAEPGWSRQPVWEYSRKDIHALKTKIKEWDYYLVMGDGFGVAFTISDDGYIGLQSISFLDFTKPFENTKTVLSLFPMGKLNMPPSTVTGNCHFSNKNCSMDFIVENEQRIIRCSMTDFHEGHDISCDITLEQPQMDSMTIAIPWTGTKAFYYDQKINCMPASGSILFDGKEYTLDPSKNFGILDWGRGVWTYNNTWYWGSCNCVIGGKPFGFNIGYGFGDTTAASENIVYYDGKGHKLDDITFNIPEKYTDKWTFTSSDGRFETEFTPVIDRKACLNAGIVMSDQHQVFGKMSGRVVLDDGTPLELKDVMCFAEKVHNRY